MYIYEIPTGHLKVLVKSCKAQLEAMHRSKQNDFDRDSEWKDGSAFKEREVCSSSDFERSVAAWHGRSVISHGMCQKATLVWCFLMLPE